MCRPSCCDNSGGQGAGIAAVAIIMGAALIVAKIGPIVAQIVHIALEVIRIAALTAGLVLAVAVYHLGGHHDHTLAASPHSTRGWPDPGGRSTDHPGFSKPGQPPGRLPGLRRQRQGTAAIGGSQYQPGACPVCEPAEWAG